MMGVSLGFIGVDWEVDWGAMDTMLSSIVLEVTGINQHFQKGVTGCNSHSGSILLTMYCGSSPMGVIHLGRAGCISAQMIGVGLGDVILEVSYVLDLRVK